MVVSATVVVVRDTLSAGAGIALPLFDGRPGHPIGVSAELFEEVLEPRTESLRQVIRRDPSRVRVAEVTDRWVLRDLDRPEDLEAARAALAGQ